MASNTKNVKLGVCRVIYDGNDLGYTQGGVEVTVKTDTHKVNVDQFGKTSIKEQIIGREVSAKVPLAESTLENLVTIMPGAVMNNVGGSAATGSITVATNPSTGDTIVVNGKTISFETVASADDEVTLGANASATAQNLADVLNASTDPAIACASYEAAAAVVNITFGNPSFFPDGQLTVDGNNYTLAAGTAGVKVTLSGAKLTGGADPTGKSVDVPTAVGVDLLDIAKELRLHPQTKPLSDKSDDFVIPLAATPGALTFAYKLEAERIYNVDFTGYPDSNNDGRLFRIGV